MVIGVFVLAGVLVFGLIIWSGTSTLRSGETTSSTGNALGTVASVFDPARGRADQELKDWENTGAIIPVPESDDRPVTVDLTRGTATIRRPRA